MVKQLTRDEVLAKLDGEPDETEAAAALIDRWLARGDGAAVYENHDLSHPDIGHIQIVSYGSPDAQLEVDEPPSTLPDIGGKINWRYALVGVCRGT